MSYLIMAAIVIPAYWYWQPLYNFGHRIGERIGEWFIDLLFPS